MKQKKYKLYGTTCDTMFYEFLNQFKYAGELIKYEVKGSYIEVGTHYDIDLFILGMEYQKYRTIRLLQNS